MRYKHLSFSLIFVVIVISICTSCNFIGEVYKDILKRNIKKSYTYMQDKDTQEGKGISMSDNNIYIALCVYTISGNYVKNKISRFTVPRVDIRYNISPYTKGREKYTFINKYYNTEKEPYSFELKIDTKQIKKIEISKAVLHKKNKSVDFISLIMPVLIEFDSERREYTYKAFDDDDMLLFRNNGIIDIDNNKIILNKEYSVFLLTYDNIDVIFKENKYFSIEIKMTFETEKGKKEDITLNLKFKRKIIIEKTIREIINEYIAWSIIAFFLSGGR